MEKGDKFSRRWKTPSQLGRDKLRRDQFSAKKLEKQELIKTEDLNVGLVEYELEVEAHNECKNYDIIVAILVNFDGILDDHKIEKKDPLRNIQEQNVDERIVSSNIENEESKYEVYRVVVKQNDTVEQIIEGWKETHKFDDYAFRRSDKKNVRVRIRKVKKLR